MLVSAAPFLHYHGRSAVISHPCLSRALLVLQLCLACPPWSFNFASRALPAPLLCCAVCFQRRTHFEVLARPRPDGGSAHVSRQYVSASAFAVPVHRSQQCI
jgi:hypothetical protein